MRGHQWTESEDELIRASPAEEVAARIGLPIEAVYRRRFRLKIGRCQRPWTEAEDRLVLRLPVEIAARYLKRTPRSIELRRRRLGCDGQRPVNV